MVGALYFVYDTLMPTDEAPPVVAEGEKPPPSKKALERKAKEKAEAAAAAAAAAGTTEATDPAATAEAPADTAPATDPATVTQTPALTEPTTATPSDVISDVPVDVPETDASAPIEGTAGTIAPDVDPQATQDAATATTDLGIPQDDPFATGDVPAADGSVDGTQPQQAPGMDASAGTDQISDGATPPESGDMTEQILKDLEKQIGADQAANAQPTSAGYTNPPDYENVGRGLVYNCVGKHWACVDGPSFKICQQNNTALREQNRSKECYPDSIYQSDSACGWVQKQKITGNAKTDFCN